MKLTDTIALVLKNKDNSRVLSIAPDQSVYQAIEKMALEGVARCWLFQKASWLVSCRSVIMRAK